MRKLLPHEIDVRVGATSARTKKGMLLLYKDSRCDMAVLDETFGANKWQSRYERIEDVLFCSIGVYNEEINDWVWKQSNGIESQGTGNDDPNNKKGEASDAFKRAGFMWGIGRELYEWKDLWVSYDKDKDKYERFTVKEISYNENGKPKDLVIVNKSGNTVYELKNGYFKRQSASGSNNTNEQEKTDTSGNNSLEERIKKSNKELYQEVFAKIGNEVQTMANKDKLENNIGSVKVIVKQQIDHYIMKDLKLNWNKVRLVKGENNVDTKGFVNVHLNDVYKEVILSVIAVYGKEEGDE